MTDKYIMVSLDDKKAEELANIISNKTSRKILDYLSEKNASETDLVKELKMPASTVNYNIKALLKSNLIEVKDFIWSGKGNKINIYKISNKTIVIAPKNKTMTTLKEFLPAILISGVGSLLLYIYTKTYQNIPVVQEKLMYAAESMDFARDMQTSYAQGNLLNPASWFFIGAVFALLVFFLIKTWRSRK
ncbi:MAG: helix-turn-helix domain-containing protein [Candidatus Nanoarchaeia archaeon]|nr:helix-turn-helix domain-containing protein [Candidatus Nanoarchaeia archaeon]